ncbi:MAG: ATP-binding cassette domain-containing protein [Synergistaceae bacterium]|nr:ATP-binding cassette domain-containing protein [Synergistaceae bacterium]
MDSLLSVKNLKKYFPTKYGALHAVDGISFDIEEGMTLGVVGESGCGKSTLGRVILRLLSLTGGSVRFKGEDIGSAAPARIHELRKDMQIIFQDPFSSIDPRMTVSQLIGEPLEIYNVCKSKADYRDRVKAIMETVGLASRLENYYPHELDGGRRQRIGIGRALVLGPRFIVCDEPVSALDVSIQAQILNLMQDLQAERNLTYIFITHNLSVVRHISDEIAVMYLGVMVEKAKSGELFKKHFHPYTKALISAIPRIKKSDKSKRIILKGELTSPIDPADACRFAPRCNYAQDICLETPPELLEVSDGHFVACHLARDLNGLP